MSSEWSLAHSEDAEYDSSFGSHRSFDGEGGGGWASWQQLGDDESFADSEQRNRDAVVFLLDATSPMLGLNSAGEQQWSNAVQLIAQFIAKKVVASPDDLIGVCLMGTRRLQLNNNSFPHVHKYVPLSNPSAAMIAAVRRLQTTEVQAEIGIGEEGDVEMFNALWCCQSMFTESNVAGGGGGGGGAGSGQHRGGSRQSLSRTNRRIMVWTTNDRPYNANDPVSRRQALQKAADLREQETEIQLFPLTRPDHKFNIFLFWKDVLVFADDESPDNLDRVFEDSFAELREAMFRKVSKKRALGSIQLQLGGDMALAVRLYCLYREAKRDSPVWLNKETNAKLTSQTEWYNDNGERVDVPAVKQGEEEGGEQERRSFEVKKYFPFGGERAFLTDAELRKLKDCGPPGLLLLGFKSQQSIRPYHNYRAPYFVYPDESSIKGSVRSFYALLLSLAELQQVAIARLIYRKATAPRLVALLPQLERVNDKGQLERPPGLHLIFLPFADDIRQVRVEPTAAADDALKNEAKKIILKLSVKQFDPSAISNPALQRHYTVVQAMALGEPLPDEEAVTAALQLLAALFTLAEADELRPDERWMEKLTPYFEAFNSLAFTEPQAVGGKRKAGGRGGAAAAGGGDGGSKRLKKEVTDEEYNAFDWEELKSSRDGWKKLTVDNLKLYLRRHGLPLSGKKDDLILRIEQHTAA